MVPVRPPKGDLPKAPPNIDGYVPKAFTIAGLATSCTTSLTYTALSGRHMVSYLTSVINEVSVITFASLIAVPASDSILLSSG